MSKDEDFLQLSGIQHFVFCPRQWSLIHLENQWSENYFTITGEQLHEKAHSGDVEKRNNLIITRALYVFSNTMKISGQCDIVEFHADKNGVNIVGWEGTWNPIPVEYKRGKEKEHNADILQLCAEAMCLEEMLNCEIKRGYLYYGQPKRRTEVVFTDETRENVRDCYKKMHEYFDRGYTPKPKKKNACNSCSIKDICIPKLEKVENVSDYIKNSLKE